jgi:hypothetical protein
MGLSWGCGDVQFFDMIGSDVDDFVDVLQCPFDEQEASVRHQ